MGLPQNLQYFINRIEGYSRQTYKISTVNADVATHSSFVTVDMPNQALIDLSTAKWHFKARATAATGAARMPPNIECIIDSMSLEANGQLISSIPTGYNHIWNIIADTTFGADATLRRTILQNSEPLAAAPANDAAADALRPYVISNWLGFLGSAQPQVIDTGALGNLRLRIGLASPSVLIGSANVAGPGFELSDMYFSVDALSIDDGQFHQAYASYLAGGGVLEVPYTDIYSFSAGNIASSGNVRFSLSTQSLDMVMATFVETATPNLWQGETGKANHFTRRAASATDNFNWQLSVNNVYTPSYRITGADSFAHLCSALNVAQDTLGGMNPQLDSLAKWLSHYFVVAYRYCHDTDADARSFSGVDSRGSVSQCFLEYSGLDVTTPKTALVFAFAKSLLRIGAGRLIEKLA